MTKAKLIPISETKAVMVNARGEEQLVELKAVDSKFYNKAPIKERLSLKGVISLLGRSDDELDEVEALLTGIDSFLVDRFLDGWFDENEEAQEEVRKILKLLDIARDKLDNIQRDVSISTNSLLGLN